MKRPLKHYIRECRARNKLRECTAVYSVTNSQGFVPSTDYFSKEVYSKDLTNYKIVKRGMIAYNPSRVNVGSLAVQNAEEQVVVSPLYVVISVDETQLLPEYLCYFLHSDIGLKEIAAHTAGSVRDSLKFSALQNIEITIRSVEDQRFIIRILQKVEVLINKRRQTLNKLDDLVKSQFIEMFGSIRDNRFNFPVGTIGQECVLKSGTSLPVEVENEGGDIPYVKVGDMTYKGSEKYILESSHMVSQMTAESGLFPPGTIIFPKRGGAIGTNKKRITAIPICADLNIMAVIPGKRISAQYLYSYFLAIDLGKLNNGSTVPQINNKDIAPLKILVPPTERQDEFARFVEQTDKSKFRIKQNLEKLEILYKSLLQEYFG